MSRIRAELFAFFRELQDNNERAWFEANRQRYEADVREPLLRFVEAFEEPLAEISPHLTAIAKKSGGSLFRIHRDVRFSSDKRPYKSWGALQFRHERARDVHAPGFYLHLAPGDVFAGAGMWHPDRDALTAARERMVEAPGEWRRARSAVEELGWSFEGDSLKRAPRGFDPEHPLIEDIRRKDLIVVKRLSEADVTKVDFLDRYAALCAETSLLMRFLADALGLEF